MAHITFEVTKDTTIVTAVGLTGNTDKIDITGTGIEKDLIKLVKKLRDHQLSQEIISAIDIEKWEEF